jgi:hypothetical protein
VALLSPDDTKLFSSNQSDSTVTVWNVDPAGALSALPGSPFSVAGSIFPAGMATNKAGTFLFVAGFNNLISAFSVASSGALTPVAGSPFSNGFPGATGLSSLAVFPPKTCCPAPGIGGASATPNILWPPNHKFVEVTVGYGVSGYCSNNCALTVSSNEPENTRDRSTAPSWKVIDGHHVSLLAERSGEDKGRTYTITITCTNDANRSASSRTVSVLVPVDHGH